MNSPWEYQASIPPRIREVTNVKDQLIAILLLYPVFFLYIRSFLSSEILYQLNNSAYKKRKKGQTFSEWLFYSRFLQQI